MDLVSDVLQAVKLSGGIFLSTRFSSPWGVSAPQAEQMARLFMPAARRLIPFHIVAQGGCTAVVEDAEPVPLGRGNVVLFPRGDGHVLRQGSSGRPKDILELVQPESSGGLPCVEYGGGGELTRLVCGFVSCDEAVFNPLGASLPRILVADAGEGSGASLEALLQFTVAEATSPRPGTAAQLTRLAELLFVEVLRRYMETMPSAQTGWLAGLRDPFIGRALAALHADPAASWTVDGLARYVGRSRSVLVERFTNLVGEAPMSYLARWRMQLASQRLRETDESIAEIATRVGYGSEEAFHRAFKRIVGTPPATWRREVKPGLDDG